MPYTGTTFITFPNGDTVDVAQTSMTVSGTSIMLTKSGQQHYHFQFSSAADARRYIAIISTVVSSFNYQPITFYMWSIDNSTWEFGSIPVNTSPIYIQLVGQNLQNTASATLVDASGRTFNLMTVGSVSSTDVVVGPFSQAGSSAPVQGNASLTLFNSSGIAVAATTIIFSQPAAPGMTITDLQYSTDGVHYTSVLSVNPSVSTDYYWMAIGTNFTGAVYGLLFIQSGQMVPIGQGALNVTTSTATTQFMSNALSLSGFTAGAATLSLEDSSADILAGPFAFTFGA